jgi:acylphosphatase
VFYRATVARRATELGITGYARNLPDGRVEVLACGTEEGVARYLEALWMGSTASKVKAVEVIDLEIAPDQRPEGFGTG